MKIKHKRGQGLPIFKKTKKTNISSASFVRETYLANNFVRLRTLSTWLISIKNTFRVFASINGQIFSGKNINFVAANQNRFQQLARLGFSFLPVGRSIRCPRCTRNAVQTSWANWMNAITTCKFKSFKVWVIKWRIHKFTQSYCKICAPPQL